MTRFLILAVLPLGLAASSPALAFQRDGSALLERADANSDGAVTRAEYAAARAASFDRLDRNDDGVVSRADLGRIARFRAQAAQRFDAAERSAVRSAMAARR